MERAALLEISRVSDTYRFRLEQPEPGAAVRQFATPPISNSDQQALRRAIEQATRGPLGSFPLEDLGRLMCSLLLPVEIQTFLKGLSAPLLISTDAPEMPWELLYDGGGQFLGLRCPIGRRLVTNVEVKQQDDTAGGELTFLLIGNPRGDLEGAEREVEQLDELVSRHGGMTRALIGRRAKLLPVQLELQREQGHTAIHYAGHADIDRASKQSALLLADRTKLGAGVIPKLLRGRPFVFLNACGTDQPSVSGRRASVAWQVTDSLATAFISGGARCVIGTRWEVDDEGAAELAVLFYEAALQGLPIGEALRQAKVRFRERHPGDGSWAAFILYGDPTRHLVPPSGLFLPGGGLNRARFDSALWDVLSLLPQEAKRLGYDFVGTPHLLIALTKVEGGRTQEALQKLGRMPKEVRDQLRRDVYRSKPVANPPELARNSFSSRARHILELADREAAMGSAGVIEERHLLLALLQEAEGAAMESLQRQGIAAEHLRKALSGAADLEIAPRKGQASQPARPSPAPEERELVFSEDARQALTFALLEAYLMGYQSVETPHLTIALTRIPDSSFVQALRQQGLDPDRVRDAIRSAMQTAGPPRTGPMAISADRLSRRVRGIVEIAADEAERMGMAAITAQHLLVGLLKVEGSSTIRFLEILGANTERMLSFGEAGTNVERETGASSLLEKLGRDLTRAAHEGKLKPLVGRQRELARLARILARADKNTPLLIGDAGVGKTAIVEGLAQRIAEDAVPPHLAGKRIIELPVSSLVAGTKYRGELEERLAQVLREAASPDVILFLDEIHTLVGAGRGEGGTLDAGNIFKPALARGEIRCIGATTLDEFRRSIEKDAALERRFQRIMVEEPTPDETLEILRALRPRYEAHHGVHLSDEALAAAVKLAVSYLPDRRLPDKACDLVDEACARVHVVWPLPNLSSASGRPHVLPVVAVDDLAAVVVEWTGVPLAHLTEAEQLRLTRLEALLHEHVVGQDKAVAAVAQAIRLGRTGLKKPNRPLGVFLFLGPSGVGKTALVKALAAVLFGAEEDMIRLDMSELMEAHSVAKLIGAPPGFIGHDEEGQLTGALRRKSYAVVLLDEIEKAHPQVLDLFLQLFDEGRLTDSHGRTADGRNAIFVMTSNLASDLLARRSPLGFGTQATESQRDDITAALRQSFRPEFLNRIDEVVAFHMLTREQVKAIADQQLAKLAGRLKEQHDITLVVDGAARQLIYAEGYSEQYGARHLERAIERLVSKPLSKLIVEGVRGTIVVQASAGHIAISPSEDSGAKT